MRKINFRGKAKMTIEELDEMNFEHENGWFYGNLVMQGDKPYIVGDFIEVDTEYTVNEFWISVYPNSVGQYTGLKDESGKKIYEGDVLGLDGCQDMFVEFYDGCFVARSTNKIQRVNWSPSSLRSLLDHKYTIVGNIYENQELFTE